MLKLVLAYGETYFVFIFIFLFYKYIWRSLSRCAL